MNSIKNSPPPLPSAPALDKKNPPPLPQKKEPPPRIAAVEERQVSPLPSVPVLDNKNPPPLPQKKEPPLRIAAVEERRVSPPPKVEAAPEPSIDFDRPDGVAPAAVQPQSKPRFMQATVIAAAVCTVISLGAAAYFGMRSQAHEQVQAKEKNEAIEQARKAEALAQKEASRAELSQQKAAQLQDELKRTIEQQARNSMAQSPAIPVDTSAAKPVSVAPTSTVQASESSFLQDDVNDQEKSRRRNLLNNVQQDIRTKSSQLDNLSAVRTLSGEGVTVGNSGSVSDKILTAAISGDSGRLESVVAEIDALAKPKRGNRKIARQLNDEGLKFMQLGQYGAAIESYGRALAADPADIEVLNSLSYAYLKDGQWLEAKKVAELAIRVAPRRAGAWNQMAVAASEQGLDWLAVRSYYTLYQLSGDRIKTREFLTKVAAEDARERVRQAATIALQSIGVVN